MKSQVTLRLARPQDAAGIARMARAYVEYGLPGWRFTSTVVLRHILQPSTEVVLAEREQRLAGCALMELGWERAHLILFAVHPRFRRAGLGSALVDWLELEARTAGITQVDLEVRAGNQGALAFYRSRGFVERERVLGYYSAREDAIRMRRDLRVGRSDD